MQLAGKIKDLSEKYRSYTAEVLGKMIRVPGFSGKEKERCEVIVELCREAGFDEVYIDGLGSVVGRVGHGPKKLAFDAHIDTAKAVAVLFHDRECIVDGKFPVISQFL